MKYKEGYTVLRKTILIEKILPTNILYRIVSSISSMNRLSERERTSLSFFFSFFFFTYVAIVEQGKKSRKMEKLEVEEEIEMTIIRIAWHFVGQLCAPLLSSNFPIWVRQDDTARDSTLPYLLSPLFRYDRQRQSKQRAKDDIERIGSTKREKKSARFLLNVGQGLLETREWSKERRGEEK